MKSPLIFAAAAAALAVGGCATTPPPIAALGDMTPEDARPYVALAGASGLYEIESSRLALARTQDPNVRLFAQEMIDDHTRTSQQLMAAARTAGLDPTPQLTRIHEEMLEELRGVTGQEFDRRYKMQQVRAHEIAVALHGNYARNGDTPALRQVAAMATPIVTQHLVRIRTLQE